MKCLAKDGVDILYTTDISHSSDFLLSQLKYINDENSTSESFDLGFMKIGIDYFIGFYNWSHSQIQQNMINWIIFNQ